MRSTVVLRMMPPQVAAASKVQHLNSLKRPLLYEGRIIDWRYCDRVACANAGVSGCHGCSNWQESQNNSK